MVWTKNEKEFIEEHPEVFEQARNPRDLIDKISSFTKYYFDLGQATKMAFAWAEVKGGYTVSLRFRKDKNGNTLCDFYLSDQYNSYLMSTFYTYGNTQIDLLRRIEKYFDNSMGIANPSAVYPNLWKEIEKITLR